MAIVFKTPISTLNTTTKDIQNIKQGDCPPCPECPEVKLESGEANYTENGEYTLTPEGDGFSKVDITVNVDTETPYNEGYAAGETAGIATGKAEGIAEQKAKLTSTTITENGITTREDGWNSVTVNVDVTTPYNNGVAAGEAAQKAKLTSGTFVSNGTYTREDGYNSVTVNVPSDVNNQDKTVDPSTSQQTVSADNGYSGLGQVTVNAVTSSIDRNIQPENIVDGVTILGVTGDVFVPELVEETYTAESIGTTTVEPRVEGNGFSSVEFTVPTDPMGSATSPFDNIETALNTDFEDGYFYADIASGEINKTTGYYDAVENIGTVFHINPYLNNPDYDPELRPEDQPDVPEFIFPEDFDLAGKNIIVWFNKANVSPINNQTKAPLLRRPIIYEFNDCDLSAINHNYDSATWPFGTLDVTENGTVDPTGYAEIDVNVQPTLQTKSVTPSDRQQVITPDKEYDGLSEVTVSGVTAAIDQNITASNIKDGVTILGVTGTYDPQPSLESQTASYTANGTYTITPSTGYDGMSDVEVTVNVSGGSGSSLDFASINYNSTEETGALSLLESYIESDKSLYDSYSWSTDWSYFRSKGIHFMPSVTLLGNKVTFNPYEDGYLSGNQTMLFVPSDIKFRSDVAGTPCNVTAMFHNDYMISEITLDLTDQSNLNGGYCIGGERMFHSCNRLKKVTLTNGTGLTSLNQMFNGCSKIVDISIDDTSNVTDINSMFYNCAELLTFPSIDTSNVTDAGYCIVSPKITTIPQLDFSKVTSITSFIQSAGRLTTLGGFTNLGKAFTGTNTNAHMLNLSSSSVLTKESIMNVINNLAAPDDTAVTDATLKLSAASYALLTEEDIAIATAKNWSVVSA